jgi:hypothetical protein
MMTRRQFVLGTTAILGLPPTMQACSASAGSQGYDEVVRSIWRHTEGNVGDKSALMRELVRYAALAPSSHNTQCWKFRMEENAISILPDLTRRCPVVDPDDHHLYASLGCATENLVQAALANGLKCDVRFDTAGDGLIKIVLDPTKAVTTPLYEAIPKRQCTKAEYDGKPLSSEELALLEKAGTGNGVRIMLLTEKSAMEKTLDYIIQGNTTQVNDPAFVKELKAWIRFNDGEATRTGDGLYAKTSGNPALPHWLGSPMFDLVFTAKSENDKCAKQVRSSAGIAVFVSEANDKTHWVEAGRCYERFALQAAALGVRNAFLNQPVEVSNLRPQFASHLGINNGRPDLIVRFGRGAEMPKSLRRPVDSILV